MSLGIYGQKTLADVTADDVDVLYSYSQTREELGVIDLQPMYNSVTDGDLKKMLGADGLYKLRLPADIFNRIGFFSVLIKPKTFETTIVDCTYIVTSDENQIEISKKGIVIPTLQFQKPGDLIGYKIEYFDKNNVKIKNFHKIITSSDLVSVSTNNTTVQGGAVTYTLDENGTNLFLTVTPDEGSIITNNNKVDIGGKSQNILLSNTFFDPLFIEIEMTDQSIKTLSYALYGNNTRDLETGIFSIFDENNELYRQFNLYTQKKQFEEGNIDIKEQRTSISLDQDFAKISQGLD